MLGGVKQMEKWKTLALELLEGCLALALRSYSTLLHRWEIFRLLAKCENIA